jgi:hypothetical protein
MTRTCRCGNVISKERLEILPNTRVCPACSTEQAYVGCMHYSHKTGGQLVYVRPENTQAVETLRREYNRARN